MSEGDPAVLDNPTGSFSESISEEYRAGVSKFENADGLAKSYIELEKSMGSRVKIPGEDATPEDKSAFYGKLGVPADATGYTLPEVEEGQEFTPEVVDRFKAIALSKNVPNEAFSGMVSEYMEWQKEVKVQEAEANEAEYNRHQDESERILREKLGGTYDETTNLAARGYTEYVPEELRNLLDTDKYRQLKNDPDMVQMFAKIARNQMDDTFVKGNGQPPLDTDFVPQFKDSPDMYKNGTDEDSVKARAYFTRRGHNY